MFKSAFLILFLALSAGPLMAQSGVAAFAAQQEAALAKRLEKETYPKRRTQMEYILRRDYSIRLEQEKEKAVRSGRLSTPEVETLKDERKALLEQLKALDEKIIEASRQAPEIKELMAVIEANEKRIAELREGLLPKGHSKPTQSEVTE